MNAEITSEKVAESLFAYWSSAHKSPTTGDWQFRWNRNTDRLGAILHLIIWTCVGYGELVDDIKLLIAIADYHQYQTIPKVGA